MKKPEVRISGASLCARPFGFSAIVVLDLKIHEAVL